jgi:hypothetical protein
MPKHYVVDVFLKAAGQMPLPVLSLPHGVQLYTNEMTKPKSTETRRFAKFNRFDYIVAPNQLRKDSLVRAGVAGKKNFSARKRPLLPHLDRAKQPNSSQGRCEVRPDFAKPESCINAVQTPMPA